MMDSEYRDEIEFGTIRDLGNGWFVDMETNIRFQIDEDGNAIDEHGAPIIEDEDDYDR